MSFARFVIADVSDAKSVLQELQAIVLDLPNLPKQPVIIASQDEPGMFDFYRRFPWFLPVHRYATPAQLLTELSTRVIERSAAKVLEFRTDRYCNLAQRGADLTGSLATRPSDRRVSPV